MVRLYSFIVGLRKRKPTACSARHNITAARPPPLPPSPVEITPPCLTVVLEAVVSEAGPKEGVANPASWLNDGKRRLKYIKGVKWNKSRSKKHSPALNHWIKKTNDPLPTHQRRQSHTSISCRWTSLNIDLEPLRLRGGAARTPCNNPHLGGGGGREKKNVPGGLT